MKFTQFVRDYLANNKDSNLTYREAMKDDGVRCAYKQYEADLCKKGIIRKTEKRPEPKRRYNKKSDCSSCNVVINNIPSSSSSYSPPSSPKSKQPDLPPPPPPPPQQTAAPPPPNPQAQSRQEFYMENPLLAPRPKKRVPQEVKVDSDDEDLSYLTFRPTAPPPSVASKAEIEDTLDGIVSEAVNEMSPQETQQVSEDLQRYEEDPAYRTSVQEKVKKIEEKTGSFIPVAVPAPKSDPKVPERLKNLPPWDPIEFKSFEPTQKKKSTVSASAAEEDDILRRLRTGEISVPSHLLPSAQEEEKDKYSKKYEDEQFHANLKNVKVPVHTLPEAENIIADVADAVLSEVVQELGLGKDKSIIKEGKNIFIENEELRKLSDSDFSVLPKAIMEHIDDYRKREEHNRTAPPEYEIFEQYKEVLERAMERIADDARYAHAKKTERNLRRKEVAVNRRKLKGELEPVVSSGRSKIKRKKPGPAFGTKEYRKMLRKSVIEGVRERNEKRKHNTRTMYRYEMLPRRKRLTGPTVGIDYWEPEDNTPRRGIRPIGTGLDRNQKIKDLFSAILDVL